jgi:YHS domain-containing protein
MNGKRFSMGALVTSLALAGAVPAFAAAEVNTTAGLTAAGAPLALHGFDPVAFFTVGAPKEGDPQFAAVHDGATYYFASKQSLDAFKANPARYVPAYGGFCAYGVSVGKKFDGNPRYWTIWRDRLYLNLNQEIAEKFAQDVAGSIAKADEQWQSIEHRPVEDL